MKKTRADIIRECRKAAVACFNYYSDTPLAAGIAQGLTNELHKLLPTTIATEGWQAHAEEYARRTNNER